MKRLLAGILIAAAAYAEARYQGKNELVRPKDYREWIWLSSGFGMAYGPGAQAADPPFDNVFVNPEAYRAFLKTGQWPDKTIFVLEVRDSQQKGSINQRGHFQGDTARIEVHVKDVKRFGEKKWAFYSFDETPELAKPFEAKSSCFTCHEASGAVETTFVQFYPTLRPIAKGKGTLQEK